MNNVAMADAVRVPSKVLIASLVILLFGLAGALVGPAPSGEPDLSKSVIVDVAPAKG